MSTMPSRPQQLRTRGQSVLKITRNVIKACAPPSPTLDAQNNVTRLTDTARDFTQSNGFRSSEQLRIG